MDQMKIIEELKTNTEFLEKLKAAENEAEISELFATKGLNVTADEIKAILDGGTDDELDENDLENVSGGYGIIVGVAIILFLAGVAKGASCNTGKKKNKKG